MGFHRENHAAGRLHSEGYLALFTVKDRGAHPHKGLPAFPLPGQGVGSVQLRSRRGSFHRENLAAGRVCIWGSLSANLHRDAPMSEKWVQSAWATSALVGAGADFTVKTLGRIRARNAGGDQPVFTVKSLANPPGRCRKFAAAHSPRPQDRLSPFRAGIP